MSDTLSTGSLKTVFRFPFREQGWQSRFMIGILLSLVNYVIPLVPSIWVGGYLVRIMRQAVRGEEPALPAWDEWGAMTRDGLRAAVVMVIYFLPGMFVFMAGMGLYFASIVYMPLTMAEANTDPASAMASMLLVTFGSMAVMFLSMALGTLLSVLGAAAVPMALAHFVAEDRLGAAFRVRQWWRILRVDKLGYFIALVVVTGLASVLSIAVMMAYYTVILCMLIPFIMAPLFFYISLVGAALFGQSYRDNQAALAARQQVPDLLPAGDETTTAWEFSG